MERRGFLALLAMLPMRWFAPQPPVDDYNREWVNQKPCPYCSDSGPSHIDVTITTISGEIVSHYTIDLPKPEASDARRCDRTSTA